MTRIFHLPKDHFPLRCYFVFTASSALTDNSWWNHTGLETVKSGKIRFCHRREKRILFVFLRIVRASLVYTVLFLRNAVVVSNTKVFNFHIFINYSPISLTCILCRILEHILASNISKHLDEQDIMYDLQHGFREKRSCETHSS